MSGLRKDAGSRQRGNAKRGNCLAAVGAGELSIFDLPKIR